MIINGLIMLINFIIKTVGFLISSIFFFLPNSPFDVVEFGSITKYLGYANYLLPIAEIIAILNLWGVAIGSYYLYQIILRWVKVVD